MSIILAISFGQWSTSPDGPLWLGDGVQAKVKATSDGGAYVAWLSDGSYHVYLQRLNSNGEHQWGDGGMVVSDQPNSSWIAVHHMNLAVDGNDNAIISTLDTRTGIWQVYAYKIAPDGSMPWGTDGLTLSISGSENISPRLTVLEDKSVAVAWCQDYATVRIQRISESGVLEWGDGGIHIQDNTGDLLNPLPVAVDDNNILLQWNHQTGPFWAPDSKLYLQKYTSSGNELWGSPVVAVGPVVFPTGNYFQESLTDNVGGSFSAWTQMAGSNQSGLAQRIDGTGQSMWGNGVEFSTNSAHFRTNPRTVIDGSQELMAAWTESNGSQSQHGVYAQRLDENGDRLWGSNGVAVEPLNGNYSYLDLSIEGFGDDMIVAYIEQSVNMSGDIYASRLNSNGLFPWFQHTVTLTTSGNSKSDMSSGKGPGCVFIVWSENGSVFAHCLLEDGTLGVPEQEDTEVSVDYLTGWNMVGLPVLIDSAQYQTLFPEAYSGSLYSFNGSYQQETMLTPGTGYLLRLALGETLEFTGSPINDLTLSIIDGWNLISGLSTPVDVAVLYGSGLVVANGIYGYDDGYNNVDMINPGKGYWVRASGSGNIILTID